MSLPATAGRAISELDQVWLAAITMNGSPVHLDAERAGRGLLGRPLVVGALTVAIAEGMASQQIASRFGPPIGWERISLLGPVYVGDVIQVETSDLGPDRKNIRAPRRVRIRAFVRDHELVAELITLFVPEDREWPAQ